ncbi:aminoacetone oxidase family FAD-binding enzyme [Pseudodesulfovibrio sp. F-1]|uniref:Aminoacetone oxidase family FAD-binding enzyme n=1 Tax=Pseudodesulfovibrio alkaliphilus TaxID=2661613 RepID=A0A7K1KKR9_9BACT|nr:aminoacetone oxidase family FAD-binding enzyme [Pseudodesulfovibrio alkaliphilus]MUM76665.1 aminoacetone oxidase family FAD-binding enzyme [Pseudodesulfovibrio alkaliphilus]
MPTPAPYDAIILGAGASGLFCAQRAAGRGLRVAVIDHADKPARKVRISGGGMGNFTNLHASSANYLCANPHFVKSALARLSPWDVIDFLTRLGVTYEEREHGQLFTLTGAGHLAGILVDRCRKLGAYLLTGRKIESVDGPGPFRVVAGGESLEAAALVLALGGPSWPQAGATDLGFRLARRFGLALVNPRPGLVPMTLGPADRERFAPLAGNALPVTIECGPVRFTDPLLFTHRGISGPAVLQISSYWREGEPVTIDFLPQGRVADLMEGNRSSSMLLRTLLGRALPKRLVQTLLPEALASAEVRRLDRRQVEEAAGLVHGLTITPSGTEGYAKAEVTVGGVDTANISSKTFACANVPGLHVIGETLDVTGHLGGFNLHWAFASAAACADALPGGNG